MEKDTVKQEQITQAEIDLAKRAGVSPLLLVGVWRDDEWEALMASLEVRAKEREQNVNTGTIHG